MTRPWEPGTQYSYGDIVEYECDRYKIIQPHMSQSDWCPPATPALWGKIPREQWQHHEPYSPPHGKGDYHGEDVHPPTDYNNHPDQNVEITHEEQKKGWMDLTDERKKQLKVGGGIAAGLALAGGAYAMYHHHEENKKSEEEKDALTWGAQSWVKGSQAKTEEFRNHGPRGAVTWVLVEGREKIPKSAFVVGKDKDDHPLYACRAFFEHGTQIGKASPGFRQGACIGYAGKTVELSTFEVLTADPQAVKWVSFRQQLILEKLGANPVEGGREANDELLYIARVKYNDGIHPAKCGTHLPGAHLAHSGTEIVIEEYEVLCYR